MGRAELQGCALGLALPFAQVVQSRLTASPAAPGFESFTAHEHHARGLWKSTTPTDSGIGPPRTSRTPSPDLTSHAPEWLGADVRYRSRSHLHTAREPEKVSRAPLQDDAKPVTSNR